MDEIESAANPAAEAEVATPEVEIEAPETEANTPAEGADEGEDTDSLDDLMKLAEGSDESANPEAVEVEYEGKKYTVAPELRDAIMRHADYTRKTMDVAEQRRAIEADRQRVDALQHVSAERLEAAFELQRVEQEYERLRNLDASGWTQEDRNALTLELMKLEKRHGELSQYNHAQALREQELRSQHIAKAREEAFAEAAKHIPNFNDARRAELANVVTSFGGDPAALDMVADPVTWQVLHYADIGKKFVERSRQAQKAKAAVAVEPAAEVTSGKSRGPAKDLVRDADKMSADEWLKQREAQLAKRK